MTPLRLSIELRFLQKGKKCRMASPDRAVANPDSIQSTDIYSHSIMPEIDHSSSITRHMSPGGCEGMFEIHTINWANKVCQHPTEHQPTPLERQSKKHPQSLQCSETCLLMITFAATLRLGFNSYWVKHASGAVIIPDQPHFLRHKSTSTSVCSPLTLVLRPHGAI